MKYIFAAATLLAATYTMVASSVMSSLRSTQGKLLSEAKDSEAQDASETGEVTQGTLKAITKEGKEAEFPLKHTEVKAEISGFLARVEVTQTFQNPYTEKIEAVYVFPLPQNAAVDDMLMKIGERTIRGLIKKREEARKMYEQAKQRGQVASLLEQERPNIFTQSVANIMPGDEILITIKYVEDLKYDDGKYEFVFPMVVGPRYIPGQPKSESSGGGWAEDTDRVPDASRITPPVLKPGERSGHDIALSVSLDAGVPIQRIKSKSHEVEIKRESDSRAFVKLKESDSIPNKDFILSYQVAGKRPEMAILTHRAESGGFDTQATQPKGFFMLMIQPQSEFKLDEITPKEMVFVVDCSGSMSGEPIAKAKQAMRRLIRGMNPNDAFQIIRFSESASQFAEKPIENTPENRERGLSYINGMLGQGGTRMLGGIKAALDFHRDPKRMRIVSFMTDGYIGNETEILAAIEDKLGDARLFSFGVGSSVNRYLLDRMAEVGRGAVQYVRLDENTEEAVNNFYERISKPYLIDIEVDWKGLEVTDVYPKKIPDLFSAQPVVIYGRYKKAGEATIELKGKVAGRETVAKIDVRLPEKEENNAVLGTLWARTRIKDLMSQMYRGEKPELVEEVTNLALEFRLMSKYTSFVAVEEKLVAEGEGPPKRVMVPVEMPEGVSYEGVFGRPVGTVAMKSMRLAPRATGMRLQERNAPSMALFQGLSEMYVEEFVRRDSKLAKGQDGKVARWQEGNCRLAVLPSGHLAVSIALLRHNFTNYQQHQDILTEFINWLNKKTQFRQSGAVPVLSLSDRRLDKMDVIFITGDDVEYAKEHGTLIQGWSTAWNTTSFSQAERDALQKYVENGGTIFFNYGRGRGKSRDFSKTMRSELEQIFGKGKWKKISTQHEIYDKVSKDYNLQGIELNGRLAVIFSAEDVLSQKPWLFLKNLLFYALK